VQKINKKEILQKQLDTLSNLSIEDPLQSIKDADRQKYLKKHDYTKSFDYAYRNHKAID
jgi:hypothetical protein